MTTYLDVGVVRIQEYINRTAGADDQVLKRRRGASRMVRLATQTSQFVSWCEANTDTYDTEGVAHLRLKPGQDPADVAYAALAVMRRVLRYAHLEASWATANSYPEAVGKLERVRGGEAVDDAGHLVWIPPSRDESLAARCAACGTGVSDTGGECPDCRYRTDFGERHPGSRAGRDDDVPASAEDEVLDRMEPEKSEGKLLRVADLGGLARLPSQRNKRNHLATVYADGNNIGALFEELRPHPELAKEVSRALDSSIKDAGRSALERLLELPQADPNQRHFPAAVTTLAADDVLITVPAAWGWSFATELVARFNTLIDDRLSHQDVVEAFRKAGVTVPRRPSLTAGLVFSHYKHPIETAIDASFHAMRRAKSAEHGRSAAIGWRDLTQSAGADALTRPFQWFTDHRDDLTRLAQVAPSQRAKLVHQLRVLMEEVSARGDRWKSGARLDGDDRLARDVCQYLIADATRVGADAPVRGLLCDRSAAAATTTAAGGAGGGGVTALDPAESAAVARLRDLSAALAVATWWPTDPETSTEGDAA